MISARPATPRETDQYDFSKGRRGAVVRLPPDKTRATTRLDNDILDWFRRQLDYAGGGNCQTLINDALRGFMHQKQDALEATLRRVIRDKLRRVGSLHFHEITVSSEGRLSARQRFQSTRIASRLPKHEIAESPKGHLYLCSSPTLQRTR